MMVITSHKWKETVDSFVVPNITYAASVSSDLKVLYKSVIIIIIIIIM